MEWWVQALKSYLIEIMFHLKTIAAENQAQGLFEDIFREPPVYLLGKRPASVIRHSGVLRFSRITFKCFSKILKVFFFLF